MVLVVRYYLYEMRVCWPAGFPPEKRTQPSDAIVNRESLLELRRHLIEKLLPVLLTYLAFEAIENLEMWTWQKIDVWDAIEPSRALRQFIIAGFTLKNISFKSGLGWFHEAIASQKKTKSLTTPPGFRLIRWQMPRKAESFSSLSRIDLRDEHLKPPNHT